MRYQEHAVPASLSAIVERVWSLEGAVDGDAAPQPVMPDGRVELVFHFGDPFERIDDRGGGVRQAPLLVCGQLDRAVHLRPAGHVSVLGVRLRSAGAAALMRVPQDELVNETIDAADVSRPLAAAMLEIRESSGSIAQAAAMLGRRLPALVDRSRVDPRVARAVAVLERRRASIGALARDLGVTPRHLERLFRAQVGLAPAPLARIHRFQRALAWLDDRHGSPRPGADAAAASGYADQAHFVREFRALAGCTPGAHLLARAELTGFFISRERRRGGHY